MVIKLYELLHEGEKILVLAESKKQVREKLNLSNVNVRKYCREVAWDNKTKIKYDLTKDEQAKKR